MTESHRPDDELDDPELAALADAILGDDNGALAGKASPPPASPLAEPLAVLGKIAALHRNLGLSDVGLTPDLEAGGRLQTWAHLRIVEQIGQGAFGTVFRAWDPNVGREVALKLLGETAAKDDDVARSWVLHEARALGAVRHPNVITVYGADRVDGRVGFWTEFIHGRTLAELVQERGPFSTEEATAIGIELCAALSAVHRAGLLHRDIKATNVMREQGDRLVLLDFGASKDFDLGSGTSKISLHPYGPTGTPLYVAPELWAGGAATPQSDIYSVGVLLYFLVTGSYPVLGAMARDVGEAHRTGRRTRLGEERPDLPKSFVEIVERAIDPEPSRRFKDAEQFRSALSAGDGRRGISRWRRRVVFPVAAALIATLVYVGLILSGDRRTDSPSVSAQPPSSVPKSAPSDLPPVAEAAPPQSDALSTSRTPIQGPTSTGEVRIPTIPMGYPSRDGRLMAYADAAGSLHILEVETGQTRLIQASTGPRDSAVKNVVSAGQSAPLLWDAAVISPKSDYVAYTWRTGDLYELRVTDLGRRGTRTLVELRTRRPIPVAWSGVDDTVICWFVQDGETDPAEADLVVVSTVDRSQRPLYHRVGGSPLTALSPDGRFVTFETGIGVNPVGLISIAVAGGQEARRVLAALTDATRSPSWLDSTHLFFLRRSTDTPLVWDGWVVRTSEGIAVGDPVKVAPHLLGARPIVAAVTDPVSGEHRIYSPQATTLNEVYVRTVDFSGKRGPGTPVRISPQQVNQHCCPSFSPDGRQIAYMTMESTGVPGLAVERTLVIQDVATGKTTPLSLPIVLNGYSPRWLPNGRSVMVLGREPPAGLVLNYYEVDVETGKARLALERTTHLSKILPDGTGILFRDDKRGLIQRLFTSPDETVVVPIGSWSGIGGFAPSPDGQTLAFIAHRKVGETEVSALVVRRPDGVAMELESSLSPERLGLQAWTSDGKHLLYTRSGDEALLTVWIVQATGGTARKTGLTIPNQPNPLSVSPQGRVVYPERVDLLHLFIRPLPKEFSGPLRVPR